MGKKAVFLLIGLLVSSGSIAFAASGRGSAFSSKVSNPVPAITSITPNTAKTGAAALTIHVTGKNFVAKSLVKWKGVALVTKFVSATALTAVIPVADFKLAVVAPVTVFSPAPGGGTSNAVNFTVKNKVAVITSMNPASVTVGSATCTLQVSGTNFLPKSIVHWKATALTTTYASATLLKASVPAADLKAITNAAITVVNPAPGGGVSAPATFQVKAQPTTVKILSAGSNDLAWDSVHEVIYLSRPSAVGAQGNAVQILNPVTGKLGTAKVAGSEPNLLSVSRSGKYLYVGLNGASTVQRMTLPALAKDIAIPLGSDSTYGPFYAMDLEAAPDSDETVAVVRGAPGRSPEEEGGVLIFDNATSRATVLCGWAESGCPNTYSGLYDSIQWNAVATEIFAAKTESSTYDFYSAPVTPAGFGTVTTYSGLISGIGASIHFDSTTRLIYDDGGNVINPNTGKVVGSFNTAGLMVPDGELGIAYFLVVGSTYNGNAYAIQSYNIHTFKPISTFNIPGLTGLPTHFIRWGSQGLAFTTAPPGSPATGSVYVISGPFVTKAK